MIVKLEVCVNWSLFVPLLKDARSMIFCFLILQHNHNIGRCNDPEDCDCVENTRNCDIIGNIYANCNRCHIAGHLLEDQLREVVLADTLLGSPLVV